MIELIAHGYVYEDNKLVEIGRHLYSEPSESLYAVVTAQDASYQTFYTGYNKMPIHNFKGLRTYMDGSVEELIYEPSSFLYKMIAGYVDLPVFNLENLPRHTVLLAKCESKLGTELFFNIKDSKHLRDIAEQYDLPYPVCRITDELIDHNRTAIRARSFDIYNDGSGNWEELVVGSVRFKDGEVTNLRVYTVNRV